jgi:hypothetical protein
VIAYKFLARGAVGPFSGFPWPTAAGGLPGAWVEAAGDVPAHGVHACRASDLPYWIDEELWLAELEGEVRATDHQLVAPRARLLQRVEAWRDVARELGDECATSLRARVDAALAAASVDSGVAELLRGYVADAEGCAAAGNAAGAAFVAARASAALAGDPGGFAAERRRQAAWLERRLGASVASPAVRV